MQLRRFYILLFAVPVATWNAAFAQTIPQISVQSTNVILRKIPLRPVSPVNYFRGLLGMKPAERERVLARQSSEQKKILLAKFQEYEAMPPDERELRLRHTQLRWYLLDLMKLAPIERVGRLASMPAEDRASVQDRLRQWDDIPPHLQKQFLESENAIGLFLRLQASTPKQRKSIMESFPPEQRKKMEDELNRWQSLPTPQRQEMCNRFHQFFELNEKEKQKALGTLSETERQQMEKTLQEFGKLAPEQRQQCVASFQKFANMPPPERAQFLKNAARWQAMKPSERQAWRDLVQKLPAFPPLPPGWQENLPPMPPGWKPAAPPIMIATTNAP